MNIVSQPSRRAFLGMTGAGVASLALSGCMSTPRGTPIAERPRVDPVYAAMYGPVEDGGYAIPAVPFERIDQRYLRQVVADPTGERPGTLVVDTGAHFLYLVREGGEAIRDRKSVV